MIVDVLGTIIAVFIGFLILIILVPIIILVVLYFVLKGNPITLKSIWNYLKTTFAKILQNIKPKNSTSKAESDKTKNIEDAEFVEIDK